MRLKVWASQKIAGGADTFLDLCHLFSGEGANTCVDL